MLRDGVGVGRRGDAVYRRPLMHLGEGIALEWEGVARHVAI